MAKVPSDRLLKRWLKTGRPHRIERLLDSEPDVARRLEALTAIDETHRDVLSGLVAPGIDFEARTVAGVKKRSDAQNTASLVVDLVGLGVHLGRALSRPTARRKPPTDD